MNSQEISEFLNSEFSENQSFSLNDLSTDENSVICSTPIPNDTIDDSSVVSFPSTSGSTTNQSLIYPFMINNSKNVVKRKLTHDTGEYILVPREGKVTRGKNFKM